MQLFVFDKEERIFRAANRKEIADFLWIQFTVHTLWINILLHSVEKREILSRQKQIFREINSLVSS